MPIDKKESNKITGALVEYLIFENKPFLDVEKASFRKLLHR